MTSQPPTNYNPLNMDKFFNYFGKFSLVIVILSAMAFTGYSIGKNTKQNSKEAAKTEVGVTDDTDTLQSPSPKPIELKSVNGGVPKSAGLSFDQYTVNVPADWTVSRENQTTLDEKLILENKGYSISIFQAATGGALCLYPGDKDFEGPSSKYTYYVDITNSDNRVLRRSGEPNGTKFTICQKSTDGSFGQPTNYGHISIKLPSAWDDEGLKTIDTIIASLKKV